MIDIGRLGVFALMINAAMGAGGEALSTLDDIVHDVVLPGKFKIRNYRIYLSGNSNESDRTEIRLIKFPKLSKHICEHLGSV